jgi:hypothetical protein
MNTDELILALTPYGLDLQYIQSAAQYRVILLDYSFLTVFAATHTEALQLAWTELEKERALTE